MFKVVFVAFDALVISANLYVENAGRRENLTHLGLWVSTFSVKEISTVKCSNYWCVSNVTFVQIKTSLGSPKVKIKVRQRWCTTTEHAATIQIV